MLITSACSLCAASSKNEFTLPYGERLAITRILREIPQLLERWLFGNAPNRRGICTSKAKEIRYENNKARIGCRNFSGVILSGDRVCPNRSRGTQQHGSERWPAVCFRHRQSKRFGLLPNRTRAVQRAPNRYRRQPRSGTTVQLGLVRSVSFATGPGR